MSFGLARGQTDLLFCKVDWHSVQQHQTDAIRNDIHSYHPDKLLNTADDALIKYFAEKYRLNVPMINRDAITVEQREQDIDVSQDRMRIIHDRSRPFFLKGARIEVEVPFSGDPDFFFIQPTSFSMSPPRGEVRGNSLFLYIQGIDLQGEQVRQQIDRTLEEIERNLSNLRGTADAFNAAISKQAQEMIASRKEKLLKDRNLVASLGFPMKPREGAAATYASPQVRRKITPTQPPASTAPYAPEPVLSDDQYNSILNIMDSMAHVMEFSPSAFVDSGEETIRSHFLVQLNGQFQGQATGETFNYEGKTDILIKDQGRNIFIAECKFWRGEKIYSETIDQLLGYLSWRDTKSAIVIFNRNKGFTNVLARMKETTETHPNCLKLLRQRSETSWVFRFKHRDDPNREMTVTVMAFDIPNPE